MPVIPFAGIANGQGLTSAVMPLALPAAPSFADIAITFEDNIQESVSPFTYSAQQFDWGADRLSAVATLPPMHADQARAWVAWLSLMRGILGRCLLYDSSQVTPRGVATGTPVVSGANQSGRTVLTSGWTPNTNLIYRSGDWLQIGTGLAARLYLNQLDVSADGSGLALLNLYPRLRESPANGAAIVTQQPVGLFKLASNQRVFKVDSALLYGVSLNFTEAL